MPKLDEGFLNRLRSNNPTLTSLDLGYNNLSDAGASALSEALKVNRTLTSLKLSETSISDAGARALSEALKVNHTLTFLDLRLNKISDASASALSEALKVNHTLTNLDLWYNKISAAGASALSEALKVNYTLTYLDLRDNNISDAGASALSEALKVNHTLTHLDLNNNNISDAGASALSEALKVNHTLTFLDLRLNKISTALTKSIYEQCSQNKALRDKLFNAIVTGDMQAVKSLLQAGVSLLTRDDKDKDNSLLHKAVLYHKPDIVQFLLAELAKVHTNPLKLLNWVNQTPLALAKEKNYKDIVALLKAGLATKEKAKPAAKPTVIPLPLPKPPAAKAKPPITAIALYDYAAQRSDELTFKAGDALQILEQRLGGWWLAQLNDKQGQIPSNYVEIAKPLPSQYSEPPNSDQRLREL